MDYWNQDSPLSRACCVGPDPYRPIVQFRFLGRILWRKFYVPEDWTRSALLPTSSDLFAAAATNRRSSRSGANIERRSDSNPHLARVRAIVSPTLYQLSYPGGRIAQEEILDPPLAPITHTQQKR